ncbi:MAG TPA: S8 family peptidase [Puia sp.]|nr:S8 family peptidase [Puia sp.]
MSPITQGNLSNRVAYGRALERKADQILAFWQATRQQDRENELPELPDEETIPVLLKVDTDLFKTDSLFDMGIEVIAEEDDGFIIGAAADNFTALKDKITKFINDRSGRSKQIAELWEIVDGTRWRLDYILSPELNAQWESIADNDYIIVDVSIACGYKIPAEPAQKRNESRAAFERRYENWQARKARIEQHQAELEETRQADFDAFLGRIGANKLSAFVSLSDSFSCRIRVKGWALKFLVLKYQYVFDVTEYDSLIYAHPMTGAQVEIEVGLEAPDEEDPAICVIDSGIQQEHRMIAFSLDSSASRSYLPGVTDTSDGVADGGHGTKVAGAVIFGSEVPKGSDFKSQVWVQNARVLEDNKLMPQTLFPPELMETIVRDYAETKLFNLSITSFRPCRTTHMSEWAASIDKLMWDRRVLFFIATGNIARDSVRTANNPGIRDHIIGGRNYPGYLFERSSRISNPAQSCFALTVGSICASEFDDADRESIGKIGEPSSFTRTGPGLWGMIKPDVVEVGGDWIREKVAQPNLSTLPETCTEVIKTTLGNGNSIGYDIGTSFCAPKVAHIAGRIYKEVSENPILIRALIAQSARLPRPKLYTPTIDHLRTYGYGVPNLQRATGNTAERITLTAESTISAKQAEIYSIRIPESIRAAGNEYEVMIEVTLSYIAEPRRTRRKIDSYLSTWLDWHTSKLGENFDRFRRRIIQYIDEDQLPNPPPGSDGDLIHWKIRERNDWGDVHGIKRQDSSLQKDWVILRAFELPSEFSIAVVGHKGWEKDITKEVPFALTVSFEVLGQEVPIYELIRVENEIEIEQPLEVEAFPQLDF